MGDTILFWEQKAANTTSRHTLGDTDSSLRRQNSIRRHSQTLTTNDSKDTPRLSLGVSLLSLVVSVCEWRLIEFCRLSELSVSPSVWREGVLAAFCSQNKIVSCSLRMRGELASATLHWYAAAFITAVTRRELTSLLRRLPFWRRDSPMSRMSS